MFLITDYTSLHPLFVCVIISLNRYPLTYWLVQIFQHVDNFYGNKYIF